MEQTTLILISFTAIIALAFIILLTYILNDIITSSWERRFEKSIKNGIEKNKIKNNDIYILAERWPINKTKISFCLNRIFDYYINTSDQDDIKLVRLREIINWHKTQDPFSELPENIKLQLITIQNLLNGNKELVLQLSTSLSELYVSKEKGVRTEKRISRLSLVVGIAGIIYTILSK
ncbi:hypothetical protein FEK47_23020 [Escherichia sp. E3659]|uniref:hypothetical protein n=1 Tax=Escherichia sp. E3659 TaxID=2044462 RepID=UPI00107FDCB3|nr:hypothetical protein [Escherichia sp. E3659]TGB81610.1 hypothetical protein CRI65_24260 [Escherichia sp. E3659]TLJ03383.1 hypothetical protein FEK47_23020 [Escherichia sp. E3659]